MRKNSYKNLARLAGLPFYIPKSAFGCDLRSESYLGNFSSSVLHIPHNSFPYRKSQWKVQVNVATPQEPKTVCRESNEINGEKKLFCV